MKVKFTGYITLEDGIDDRGTVDNWTVCSIQEIIEAGPELDDIYEKLQLSWEVVS